MKVRLLFSGLFLYSMMTMAINFSRVNVAWQYDVDSPVQAAHRVISKEGAISVFLRVRLDTLRKWNTTFLLQDGFEVEKHEEISPNSIDTLQTKESEVLVKLAFGTLDQSLLVLKIFSFERFYYYDIALKVGTIPYPSIFPVDAEGIPILDNFINRSGFQWKNSDYFQAIRYQENFGTADPPMADMKPLAPRLKSDSSFVFTDSISFKDGYFYTVLEDSLAASAVTILKVPPYFPKYRQLRELVETMFYITSEPEKKSLVNSKDLKKNFDSFWINNFNTKPRARGAIRKYYESIEKANLLFTDFKAGWKTDRGMMYIVFGMPDEVYRTNSLEEWYYDSGLAFEYSVISSFFASRTYTLRRSKDLEEAWFQAIAAIRRGINE